MPKLPDIQSLGNRPVPQSGRQIVGYKPDAVEEAMIETGNTGMRQAGEMMRQRKAAQDQMEEAYAKSNLLQGLVTVKDRFKDDQDYSTFEPRFQEETSKLVAQSAAMISDPARRKLFEAEAGLQSRSTLSSVLELADTKRRQYGQVAAQENADRSVEAAATAGDPALSMSIFHALHDTIDGSVASGILTPEQGYALRKNSATRYGEAWLAAKPAEEQVKLLTPTAGGALHDMGADTVKPYSASRIQAIRSLVDTPSPYDDIFKQVGDKTGVDWRELKTRAAVESSLRPDALGPKTKYGQAAGIMQLTEDTAKSLGVTDRFDPRQSIEGGAKLLAEHMKEAGGDLSVVDKRYYGGPDSKNWGRNTEQYAENLRAVRGGEEKTGSPVDFIPVEKRMKLLEQAQNEVRSEQIKYRADLERRVKDSTAMAMQGVDDPNEPRPEDFTRAFGKDEGDLRYREFADVKQLGQNIQRVKTMTPAQQADLLEQSKPQAGPGFEREQQMYGHLLTAVKTANEQRASDPVAFAQANGMADSQPLDFADAQAARDQLAHRAATAQVMNRTYGTPVKVLTNDEAKRLSLALDSMKTNDKLAYLKSLRDGLDDTAYKAAVQQIRPDSPVTAMAGMYLGLERTVPAVSHTFSADEPEIRPGEVAAKIMQGESLLNESKGDKQSDGTGKRFPMPPDGTDSSPGLRQAFNDKVKDAFRGQPQAADQAYQAFRAYYAADAAQAGKYDGVLDETIAKRAAKAVIGGSVIEKNGKNVIPPWGMDETTFNDLAKTQFDAAMQANGIKGVGWDSVGLESTGQPGVYGIPVGAGYLIGKGGRPVTIDLNKAPATGPKRVIPQAGDKSSLGITFPE